MSLMIDDRGFESQVKSSLVLFGHRPSLILLIVRPLEFKASAKMYPEKSAGLDGIDA